MVFEYGWRLLSICYGSIDFLYNNNVNFDFLHWFGTNLSIIHFFQNLFFYWLNLIGFFLCKQHLHSGNFTALILVLSASISMLNLLLYCYFGKMATESFEKMSDCVYELNWQVLPINLQKYILIMIINMQKSLYYHGFEVAVLNLNTYLRVSRKKIISNDKLGITFYGVSLFFCQLIKTVLSYYLIFKTITSE